MARDYEQDERIASMAARLIQQHHPHLLVAAIAYVMKRVDPANPKPKVKIPRSGKRTRIARAIGVPALWHSLCGFVFVIEVDQVIWDRLTLEQQEAVVDHELCHCAKDVDGYYVRHHDVEEFRDILERHGFWHPMLEVFCSAAQPLLPFENEDRPRTSVQ